MVHTDRFFCSFEIFPRHGQRVNLLFCSRSAKSYTRDMQISYSKYLSTPNSITFRS